MSETNNQLSVVPASPTGISRDVAKRVRKYVDASKAINTKLAYGTAWAGFEAFCEGHGYPTLPAPPAAVIDYITHLADLGQKASTLSVKLAAISFMHRNAKQPNPVISPEVAATIAGIRRSIGTRPARKAPATTDVIRSVISTLPNNMRGIRDKALLLIGFAGAFRRSELVAVRVEDLRFDAAGLTITLPRSKTDQEGAGMTKAIPMLRDTAICPVRALRAWLAFANISSGVVFRSIDRWEHTHGRMDGREVARIVKRAAEAAGIDSRQFAGHSLRAGFVTQAAIDGVETWAIKEQTGHKSDVVLNSYIRAAGRGARGAVRTVFGE